MSPLNRAALPPTWTLLLLFAVPAGASELQGIWTPIPGQRLEESVEDSASLKISAETVVCRSLGDAFAGDGEFAYEAERKGDLWTLTLASGKRWICSVEDGTLNIAHLKGSDEAPAGFVPQPGMTLLHLRRRIDDAPPPVDVAARLEELTRETAIDERLLVAAAKRDKAAASLLQSELENGEGSLSLVRSEIAQVLRLDFHRPQLHLRAFQSAAEELSESEPSRSSYLLEFAHQEAEYLRASNAPSDLLGAVEALESKLPQRSFTASSEFVEASLPTFAAGAAMYIEYDSAEAIVVRTDDETFIHELRIPIRYVRSPKFPPRGCRVVATMTREPEAPNETSPGMPFADSGYLPCALLAGRLEGEYAIVGPASSVAPGTRIIAYVASASADDRPLGVPLSNVLSIPVVVQREGSVVDFADDDPFLDASRETSNSVNRGPVDASASEETTPEASTDPEPANASSAGP
jgi:hypothetical protein